jgi:hypothetical protein
MEGPGATTIAPGRTSAPQLRLDDGSQIGHHADPVDGGVGATGVDGTAQQRAQGLGEQGAPNLAVRQLCSSSAAPVTIELAPEVPPKSEVYAVVDWPRQPSPVVTISSRRSK